MRYKIGDIARLFNLSTESIRHYERQGLIHPQKAEGSSYRYYQAWDMAVLSACRQYRALGFTLEESADMLGQRKPTAVLDELRGREVAIEQEIARQCRLLRTVRAWRTEAEAACALMGRFELETNAATRFLPYQYGDELTRDEGHLSCVREWLGHIPYVYVGMLVLSSVWQRDVLAVHPLCVRGHAGAAGRERRPSGRAHHRGAGHGRGGRGRAQARQPSKRGENSLPAVPAYGVSF